MFDVESDTAYLPMFACELERDGIVELWAKKLLF